MWNHFRGPEPSHSGPPPSAAEAAATSYEMKRPGFSLHVDGGSIDPSTWMIHAVLVYRPHLAMEAESDVEADGRRELVLAIAGDARAARERGARSIYVVVEGDEELAGFFRVLNPRLLPRKARHTWRSGAAALSP